VSARVLYSNPPWWEKTEWKWKFLPVRRAGVRAGSRWPFTYQTLSLPGWRAPFEYLPMPFFMTYAASYVAKATGAEVVLRDSIARRESYESYWQYVGQNQFDFIFIESATPSWDEDSKTIRKLHELSPKTQIVVCGPITSVKSVEILEQFPVVACIKGEYEKGSVAVVNGKRGVIEHDLLTVAEMNSAPWPMYDETVATAYYDRNPRGVKLPQAQLWASRGCPYKCIFCVWPAAMTGNDPTGEGKRTVRYYTAKTLEPFLRSSIEKYGYRSVYFDDDTFNLGNQHTIEMSEMMARIGLPWSAMCRADTIKMETWSVMKQSGCYGVKLGFESGNQYVVDKIVNKHLDLNYAAEVVHHLRKIGMSVHGTFTIGLPGETPEQVAQTVRFAHALPLNSRQISGTAEIEGTPLHTLRNSGSLTKYEGATMDANYHREVDGNKKAQQMAGELQRS
jgi:radical SAM superfamily enzyme YgiQ (UPF0313 family)